MTERFKSNDDSFPQELSDLLAEHYATPLPDHLRQRVDQELVQALQESPKSHTATTNGIANDIKPNPKGVRRWKHTLIRCVGMAAATAACWAILFSGFGDRGYTWAATVEAMQRQPWLEIVNSESGERHGWLSVPSRIVARSGSTGKSDSSIWLNGMRSIYLSAKRAIYQDPVSSDLSMSNEDFVKAALLRLILGYEADENLSEWEVVEESRTAQEMIVELMLRFEHANSSRTVTVILGIDKQAQHPVWMRVLGPDGSTKQQVDFNYVAEGPDSIYVLGVPRDSEVIEEIASAGLQTNNTQSLSSADVDLAPLPDRKALGLSRPASTAIANSQLAMSRRVDELLDKQWQSLGVTPSEPAADFEFLRRVYLDLTGRVPTIAEIRRFEKESSRTDLIAELLKSRDCANHFGSVWRAMLLPSEANLANLGGTAKLDAWLAEQFRNNVPYDAVVEKLLLAEGRVNETGPLLFYAAAKMNPEEIATQASRAFLGTRLECAQCHDHPFDNWTQEEFWGLAAFFARISRPQGELEMVSPVLRVSDNDWGDVKLPDSDTIVAPHFPFPLVDAESTVELGDVSRRQEFADWLTDPSNTQFSKATVNRVWAHLFGRGLVDPVDDMGSHNPPFCPELLDELTTYFVQSGFDLRQLISTLVETSAYQLSSRSLDDDPERTSAFAQMNIKSFTAEQLYDSIATATLRQESRPNANAEANPFGLFVDGSRESFLEMFRVPPGSQTDYQAGIPQALMLINGDMVSDATVETGALLKSLQAPFFTDDQRIEMLFLATLSRKPEEQEAAQIRSYLQSTEDNSTTKQRLSDILWTLLNSAEFTLNH